MPISRRSFLATPALAAPLAVPAAAQVEPPPGPARPWRKIHLDYHNSEHMPRIADKFDAAAATAERAADAARRWTGIKDSGAVSAADLLSYQMAAKEAQAKLALAKAQLDQTSVLLDRLVLRSPIAATVLQVGVRAGEFVAAGAKAPVVLGDITRLQIRCDVDEQLATRMREGLPAKGYLKGESSLAGGQDRSIALKFVRIEPFVIPKTSLTGASIERVDTRVLQVIYQFDRPTGRALFVGQQMDVYIDASQDAPGK